MILGAKICAIAFSGDEVRVALVAAGAGAPQLLSASSATAQYDLVEARADAMAAALDGLLSQLKQRPAAYVFVADCRHGIARAITIPLRGRRQVEKAVRFELEPYLAFPIEDLAVDYTIVTEVEGETEVLAMGVRRDYLDAQLAILAAAGIEPDAVTLDAAALNVLWQRLHGKPKGLAGVLHLGAEGSLLTFSFNGTLAFFRHLGCTRETLTADPAGAAREIQNTVRAFLAKWRGGGALETLHVTGARFAPYERDALAQALRMPVADEIALTKLKGGAIAAGDGALDNRFESLAGAAIGAGGGVATVDFRRTAQSVESGLRGVAPHLMFSCCLALLALVGLAFHYYLGATRLEADAAALQQQIAAINTDIESMASQGLGEGIETGPFTDPPLLDLLAEIALLLPPDKISLDDVRIAAPGALGAWLTLRGNTPDAAHLNDAIAGLSSARRFALEGEPEKRAEAGAINFTIKARRPDPAAADAPPAEAPAEDAPPPDAPGGDAPAADTPAAEPPAPPPADAPAAASPAEAPAEDPAPAAETAS